MGNLAAMRPVDVGGVEIEYAERGEGEPILLVHGGGFGDWFLPTSASPSLDGFRVIRVRRAGYGAARPPGHITIADHARHLATLADGLGLDKMHVVGHSSSALMGLRLAVDRPDLVHSLVLLEPAPAGPLAVPASAVLGERFIGPAMAAFGAGDVERAFDWFFRGVGDEGYRAVMVGQLGKDGYEHAIRDSAYFFADELGAVGEWQFGAAEWAQVRQPTLLVEGGESRKLGPMSGQITERATSLLPLAETIVVDGVNHLMPLQDPVGIARLIADFARQHPIAAAGATASA